MIAMLDALGIASCGFCGLSMGGVVGRWLGINAASRIDKLVLCNTAATIGTADIWNARIAAVENGQFQSIVPAVLGRCFTPSFIEGHPETIACVRKFIEASDPAGYAACCVALRDADLRSCIQRINAPVLVVAGAHDLATPPPDGRFLADGIPNALFCRTECVSLIEY